ncbi:sulfotransferase [Mesorhizobium sp. VNQ89]|uniref:tetratricopeptide repeat-containing sulfotransferase family protein n=1 Tax=Mesorhizobium quangtriensis TaxID=3157709 RepID=UPI0032B772A4
MLAEACEKSAEYEDAIVHLEHVLTLRPTMSHALAALGRVYHQAGKGDASLATIEKGRKAGVRWASMTLDQAIALIGLGRMKDAEEILRRNIAQGVMIASCYRLLADSQKFTEEPADLAAIRAVLRTPGLADRDRMNLHVAAGKICNDIGRYEEAIDHFRESKNPAVYDIDAFRRRVDTLVHSFTPSLISSKAGLGDPSELPVFVLGMPRSGTTLAEQICASHPAVFGAGEIAKLGSVLGLSGYAQSPSGKIQKPPQELAGEEVKKLATEYLNFIRALSPDAQRIVNKMPHNFQYIGMIALLWPNAKIIHCTRDPIDNCISCFMNSFNDRHTYNADFTTLGLYYREYHRLMQHWNALLPGKIYECNYETMIAYQEGETRRLIDFLGLPWDDACLRFYENERTVTTHSRWQVRQPIYKSSVKRWKKYGDKIQPLIDALGDLADTE